MDTHTTLNHVSDLDQSYLFPYEDWLNQQVMSENTKRAYYSRIKQFLFFLAYTKGSDKPVSKQSELSKDMSSYLKFLKQSRKGNGTINAYVNALKNFSQFLGMNAELKRERCYNKNARVLTVVEQERFLQAVNQQESNRDKAIALILISTGLRAGDCARLKVENVGAGTNSICLDNGARVPLDLQAAHALRQWMEERKKINIDPSESGLWLTKQGNRLKISGMTSVIERIGWQANLVVSVEMVRRTWLTKATNNLNKVQIASKYGGYIGKSTLRRYAVSLSV